MTTDRGTKTTKGTQADRPRSASLPSAPSPSLTFIPPHGGYEKLLSYQKALVVYDATLYFCDRFIDKRSRTHDQMVQAARSDKQNIIEGSEASGTSKEPAAIAVSPLNRKAIQEAPASLRLAP